jgi:hypothetical protein
LRRYRFALDKYKILPLWCPYVMNMVALQAVQEVDLGTVIQEDLKWAKLCEKVVHKHEKQFLKLYASLVRTQLNFAMQAWRPHLQIDTTFPEKVPWRVKKLIVSSRENATMKSWQY